jgi:acetylornithine deacetylase/succinyl-diaminopimelate desuccinylase-like protein
MTPIDSTAYKAAAKAIAATFGKEPIPVRGGGSIPICSILERELASRLYLWALGWTATTCIRHEKYNIENYYKGIQTIPYFHKYFAELSNGKQHSMAV